MLQLLDLSQQFQQTQPNAPALAKEPTSQTLTQTVTDSDGDTVPALCHHKATKSISVTLAYINEKKRCMIITHILVRFGNNCTRNS